MKLVLLAVLLLIFNGATALEKKMESRAVVAKETDSFNKFYLRHYIKPANFNPEFSAIRRIGEKKWTVTAVVSGAAGRGYKNLCHAEKYHYIHTDRIIKGEEWKIDEYFGATGTDQHAWLDTATDCSKPARTVVLNIPIPDVDVLDLLQNKMAIFGKSTSLIAGYSGCDWIRPGKLKLVSIGTGNDTQAREMLYQLTYAGDDLSRLVLLVRKIGHDFTPWSASCPMP